MERQWKSIAAIASILTHVGCGSLLNPTSLSYLSGPTLSYLENDAIFIRNTSNVYNTPKASKDLNSYKISPALPTGLTLDGSSGVISGVPDTLQARSAYTVTGTAVTGKSVSAIIYIRVVDGWEVDDTSDLAWNTVADGNCVSTNGTCTLRAAIQEGNAVGGAHIIRIPPNKTVSLGSSTPNVTHDMTLYGGGSIVDGAGSYRILAVDGGAVTSVVDNIILQNGNAVNNGSALLVLNGATVTLKNSTVRDNTASGGVPQCGGVVTSDGGGGDLTVDQTLFQRNTTPDRGGAVCVYVGDDMSVTNSYFYQNQTNFNGGAISFLGNNGTVTHNTFEDNTGVGGNGGGLYFGGLVANISNNTFYANTAVRGGGLTIETAGLTVQNNTFVSNHASDSSGGGLNGGAVYMGAAGVTTLRNNILLNNTGTAGDNACQVGGGTWASGGNNILSTTFAADPACNLAGGSNDQESTDPLLGPLQDNGGSTKTFALNSGSPAINAGSATGCPTDDQRGSGRSDGACDIGSYER